MPSETRAQPLALRAFLNKDRLSPLYQSVGEIVADALAQAERHGRDPRQPIASIFKTADMICNTIRGALDAAAAVDELCASLPDLTDEEYEALKADVERSAAAPAPGMTCGSHVRCPDCGADFRVAIAGRKKAAIPKEQPCFRCWQQRRSGRADHPTQETDMNPSTRERPTLHCYFIVDVGAEAYVAAQDAGEALHIYVSLQGGDCDSREFTTTLVPDEKIPDFKIQQSESAERPEGYTLREMLEEARRGGRPEILSTSEF